MGGDAVIPQTDGLIIPPNSHLNILRLAYMFEQELQKSIRFLVFETDDLLGEAGVDEESFVSGCLKCRMLVIERERKSKERTGWMRTMGCSDFTGSLLTNFPSLLAFSACG